MHHPHNAEQRRTRFAFGRYGPKGVISWNVVEGCRGTTHIYIYVYLRPVEEDLILFGAQSLTFPELQGLFGLKNHVWAEAKCPGCHASVLGHIVT